MNSVLSYIENKIPTMDRSDFPRCKGLIIFKKENCIGISLKDSILMIHIKKMYSYRINYSNLNNIKEIGLAKEYNKDIDIEYLEHYFKENRDNPYAVFYVFNKIIQNYSLLKLTQFPPLFYPKTLEEYNDKLNTLIKLAEPGDLFFTYNRKSGLSKLIRNSDCSMWSHCGLIGMENNFVEMTTSGNSDLRKISSLYNSLENDIVVYRKFNPTESDKIKAKEYIIKMSLEKHGYSWSDALKIYFNYKLGKQFFKTQTTLRQLIMSSEMELIAYA